MPIFAATAVRAVSQSDATNNVNTASTTAIPLAAAAYKDGAEVDNQSFVYHMDLILLGIIALFVLFRLPRTFIRLSKSYERTDGFFLRKIHSSATATPISERGASSCFNANGELKGFNPSASVNGSGFLNRSTSALNPTQRVYTANYPPHVPCSYFISLYYIVARHRTRIIPGVSIGQSFCVVIYLAIIMFAGLYHSNPFTDNIRDGWLAMSQIPIIFAFAAKNNIIGALTAVGYEKLNFFHRVVGRVTYVAVTIHALGFFYKWTRAGTFVKYIGEPNITWGLVAFTSIQVLTLFSIEPIRKRFHNVFISTHVSGIIVFLVGAYQHQKVMAPYVYAAIVIYGFDRVFMRTLKSRVATATIYPIQELGLTCVEIPSINAGWRAGQHVRLQVLSLKMGIMGWAEVHPFTIASVSATGLSAGGVEGMVLMCKKVGTWTGNLYDLASQDSSGGVSCCEIEHVGKTVTVNVRVEGPYGGPGNTNFSSFSSALLIVGGSGITFGLSVMQDLLQREMQGRSCVQVLELVWIVQDPDSAKPLLPTLNSFIQQSQTISLRISIFYTRNPRSEASKLLLSQQSTIGVQLIANRPQISKVVEAALNRTVSAGGLSYPAMGGKPSMNGMIVGVCGPAGLGDSVTSEVGRVSWSMRNAVGGVEIYEETFGM